MKRSDMISRIGDMLSSGSDEEAAAILDELERLGMLPPPQGSKFVVDTVQDVIHAEWEHE